MVSSNEWAYVWAVRCAFYDHLWIPYKLLVHLPLDSWRVNMCTDLETQAYIFTCLCCKLYHLNFSSEEGTLAAETWGWGWGTGPSLLGTFTWVAVISTDKATLQKCIQFAQLWEMLFLPVCTQAQRGWLTAFWNLTCFLVEEVFVQDTFPWWVIAIESNKRISAKFRPCNIYSR